MSSRKLFLLAASSALILCLAIQACKKSNTETITASYPAVQATFGTHIDLNNLENYSGQSVPAYITRDNSGSNPVTNAGATLGRVLFYDKALSANNTIACGSCHKQALAFGDDAIQSIGVNGVTTRHSMRLVNARFAQEIAFFWDKRATTLENQTTQPIQNHNEMGFSGANGDKDINFLIAKLQGIGYYKELFKFVYGDSVITQTRMQTAIAQFIRSIQSFDSKFDDGMAVTKNLAADFPNFTAQENLGKQLFLVAPAPPGAPAGGGFGCQGCHRAPEFDIDPNSRNNGIISVAGSATAIDITNTNPPSLRNLLNASGQVNGLYMHDGSINNLSAVIDHYAHIVIDPANTNLDPKLMPGGRAQVLNVTQQQKDAIIAFLATLSGKDVYTNKMWASPFK
ncbi:cytochrome-c peroxidase [Mucilaginibacter sp. AW1-3]